MYKKGKGMRRKSNLNKKHTVLLIALPLAFISMFSVGFSSWSYVNSSNLSASFNVEANTGTYIDISDCIELNGEISKIKYYGGGFLQESANGFEKSNYGSLVIPLQFTRSDYNFKVNISIVFHNEDSSLSDINFSTKYVHNCEILDSNSSVIGIADMTSHTETSVNYSYSFNGSDKTFKIRFNLRNFDDQIFSYLSNDNNYLTFALTTEII